eukprot:PhM_4_TR10093/c0_g2_i1/m.19698
MSTNFVSLNVGGRSFCVLQSTLVPTDTCENYFSGLFAGQFNDAADDGGGRGVFMLDRDPDIFSEVLFFLRYGYFRLENETPLAVFDDLAFFGYDVPVCSASMQWHGIRHQKAELCKQPSSVVDPLRRLAALIIRSARPSEQFPLTHFKVRLCPDLDEMVKACGSLPSIKVYLALAIKEHCLSPTSDFSEVLLMKKDRNRLDMLKQILWTELHHTFVEIGGNGFYQVNSAQGAYSISQHFERVGNKTPSHGLGFFGFEVCTLVLCTSKTINNEEASFNELCWVYDRFH